MSGTAYDRLSVKSKFAFDSIINFSMRQCANEHATAVLRCVLVETGASALLGNISGEMVTVLESGNAVPIFQGGIENVHFYTENGLAAVELNLSAGSSLLDIVEKSKSYQDVALTYDDIIYDVLDEFPDGAAIIADEI